MSDTWIWCMWLMQSACFPRSLAFCNAGNSSAARMATIATTTRSSIRVNARLPHSFLFAGGYPYIVVSLHSMDEKVVLFHFETQSNTYCPYRVQYGLTHTLSGHHSVA